MNGVVFFPCYCNKIINIVVLHVSIFVMNMITDRYFANKRLINQPMDASCVLIPLSVF